MGDTHPGPDDPHGTRHNGLTYHASRDARQKKPSCDELPGVAGCPRAVPLSQIHPGLSPKRLHRHRNLRGRTRMYHGQ
jgi:hypothetical protein